MFICIITIYRTDPNGVGDIGARRTVNIYHISGSFEQFCLNETILFCKICIKPPKCVFFAKPMGAPTIAEWKNVFYLRSWSNSSLSTDIFQAFARTLHVNFENYVWREVTTCKPEKLNIHVSRSAVDSHLNGNY